MNPFAVITLGKPGCWILGVMLVSFLAIYAWLMITELCDEADDLAHFENPDESEP